MIIVEGLDNTGKTTLVSKLMDEFLQELRYRPSIGNKHNLEQIRIQAEAEAFQYRPNVLSDRSRIISEWIYQPILGVRSTAYPIQDWMRYLTNYVSRPQLLIYCVRDIERVRAGFEDKEQLSHVEENLEALARQYDTTMEFIRWLFEQTRGHIFVEYSFDQAISTENVTFDPYVPVKDAVNAYLDQHWR